MWNVITEETVVTTDPFSEHSSTGHMDTVYSVAFSPNGQWIASGSYDKTICVWNAMTGEKVVSCNARAECNPTWATCNDALATDAYP